MSKTITKQVAEDFLEDPYIDLNEYEAIDDDAAAVLASKKRDLRLAGLTSLSVTAATSLAKQKGDLFMEGLTIRRRRGRRRFGKAQGRIPVTRRFAGTKRRLGRKPGRLQGRALPQRFTLPQHRRFAYLER